MAVTVQWVMDCMEAWAPISIAEEWDNVGLLVGDATRPITRVLVALDATDAVVEEAATGGYDVLVTHHPMLFTPLKRITQQDTQGRKILRLIQQGISLYAAHTNLDMADGGTNDLLFDRLSLREKEPLMPPVSPPDKPNNTFALGRIGYLPAPMSLVNFANYIKERLHGTAVRYTGAGDTSIYKVALCTGDASNARYCRAAKEKQCDVYVTGDLRYHGAQEALAMGLSLVDITHYASEAPVVDAIVAYLQAQAAKVQAAKAQAANSGAAILVAASRINGQVFTHAN